MSENESLLKLIDQLKNYENEIKKNNILNDDLIAQHITSITSNILWKNDKYYQEQLILFKDSAENISNSCTKFTKLITLKTTNEAINSIVDEIATHSYNLYTYFSVLIIHPMGKPLYKLIIYSILGLLHHLIELLNIGLSNNFNDLNSITGIIWEICDKIKVIPISNKAAFKRNFLENIFKIKDVIREFNGYIDETITHNNNNEDNNNESKENIEEDDEDDEDEFYNNDELIFVQKSIKLMEICVDTIKLCNDIITTVADKIDDNNEIESNKIICRKWINKLVILSDMIDEAIINLGAELYAPIVDINFVETNYYNILYNHLCNMKDLLICNNDNSDSDSDSNYLHGIMMMIDNNNLVLINNIQERINLL